MELTKREITMLTTFLTGERYWKRMPTTVKSLLDKRMIKLTPFGMGNFQISEKGRDYLRQPEVNTTGHWERDMEFEHTPGPWKWWTSNSFLRLSSDADGKDGGVICPTVSRADGHPDLIVSKADMALIATAPRLLEALQDALHAYDKHGEDPSWDFAREVIAKATGQ